MIKKIAIFGSTGSVGKNTIDIIRKDKNKFKIVLLSTNANLKNIIKQAKEFKEVYDNESEWPDWIWDLDWDLHNDKPGNDDVLSIRLIKKHEEQNESNVNIII